MEKSCGFSGCMVGNNSIGSIKSILILHVKQNYNSINHQRAACANQCNIMCTCVDENKSDDAATLVEERTMKS